MSHPIAIADAGGDIAVAEAQASGQFTVPITQAGQAAAAARQGLLATPAVTAANPVTQLLGRDPDRTIAWLIAVDAPVLLAASKELAQQANAAAPAAAPPSRIVEAPANPAAGAGFTYTMPVAGRLQAIGWTFTADAVAVTRYQDLVIADSGGATIWQQSASGSIAASQVSYVAMAAGFGTLNQQGAGLSESGLPDLDLAEGDTITISITAADAGDQISAITLVIIPAQPQAAALIPGAGYLPAGVPYPWQSGDQLYAAYLAAPTRITVQDCRRLPEPDPRP